MMTKHTHETTETPATEHEAKTTMIKLPRKKKASKLKVGTMKASEFVAGKELTVHEPAAAAVSEAGSEHIAEETPPAEQAAPEMFAADGNVALATDPLPAHAEVQADPPAELAVPAAPKGKAPPTVMVTLPFKGQSVAFIEVVIGDKTSWLAKSSLTSYEVEDDQVLVELPRPLARRRGLLAA